MHAKETILRLIAAASSVFLIGCAGTSAPIGWLPDAEEAQREGFGAWIDLRHTQGNEKGRVMGELISVGSDSVYVLTQNGFLAIPKVLIKRTRITGFNSHHGTLALWTLMGTLSVGSHGYYLMLTAPVWIISGTIASASQSRAPIKEYPTDMWDDIRMYARFPQGLPKNINPDWLDDKTETRSLLPSNNNGL